MPSSDKELNTFKLIQTSIVKVAARIALRFVELREWKFAVLGGIDNSRFHLNKLLSSG
jgi:hypothetical protein